MLPMNCKYTGPYLFAKLYIAPCPVIHTGLVYELLPGDKKPRYRCQTCGHTITRKNAKKQVKQIRKLNRLGWREYMRRRELKHKIP